MTDGEGRWSLDLAEPIPGGVFTLEASLQGPHVLVHNNEAPNPQHRAGFVTVASGTGRHSWSWAGDDSSPAWVATNAFYHANVVHRWFQSGDPFDVLPSPNPMPVVVRDGPYCNAFANLDGLWFGSGDGACRDFALCSDVIYHEYTHRIIGAIYTDPFAFPYHGQTGAMNEAFADFFSGVITNDPVNGEGCYEGRDFDDPDAVFPRTG